MYVSELLGALVGAGFASGKEIASFFARYGMWGYAGAVIASCVMLWLMNTQMPNQWSSGLPGLIWQGMFSVLLMVTGGAMLSGAGEIAERVLPFRQMYWAGSAVTLLIAWLLACKIHIGLAWVSRVMLVALISVILSGFLSPGEHVCTIQTPIPLTAVGKGVCYGGFNAALLLPVLQRSGCRSKERVIRITCIFAVMLLFAGINVLQRHPELLYEPIPFIHLLNRHGRTGYLLGAGCLYLAILSTLTACIRGMSGRGMAIAVIAASSAMGFGEIIDAVYPVLGGGCTILLLAAKFRNCSQRAFHSSGSMI